MRRPFTRLLLGWMVTLALACSGAPEGVDPVDGFELERYLGTWYEIARLDHRFERGLEDISARYTQDEDGSIAVRNRGFDVAKGEWREARGRARPVGDTSVGSLEVSFFGPFYAGYHVIALDEDSYRYALVSGPGHDYLWILSREKVLARETTEALLAFAREAGYDVDSLIWVVHARSDPALLDE